VLGRRVLAVKICSCPKRDMEREENDTRLKKNIVFRRNKKCISQDTHHNNNNRHHHNNNNNNDKDSPPCKTIKLESSSDELQNTTNIYTLPVSITFSYY